MSTPSKPDEALLTIRVTPRASKSKVEFDAKRNLKAWITAPPVDGAANEAICLLISKTLDVSRSMVDVVSGHTSRNKTIRVCGISSDEAYRRIGDGHRKNA
ncbi:MAG: DUF167 domain-containing protein [Chlorobia bacterium]|nr:DUF167 domain-containing protein [Fimbriimonadaceae bacterium]